MTVVNWGEWLCCDIEGLFSLEERVGRARAYWWRIVPISGLPVGALFFEVFRQHFKVVLYKAPRPEQAPDSGPKVSPLETSLADVWSITSRTLKGQDPSAQARRARGHWDPQVPAQGGFARFEGRHRG